MDVIVANNVTNQTPLNENRTGVASLIREKFVQERPSQPSIFRIPKILQGPNEAEFVVPKVVSIGPYHHGKKNLDPMERIKLWYLHRLFNKEQEPAIGTSLEYLVQHIRGIEQACRDCYDERIDMTSDDFVQMMLIDGCFLLEFMRRQETWKVSPNAILETPKKYTIISDLFLLENQLPWFVLDFLFHNLMKENSSEASLSKLAFDFGKIHSLGTQLQQIDEKTTQIKHLLDYMRLEIIGPEPIQVYGTRSYSIPPVTELLQMGVKFRSADYSCNPLKQELHDGVMVISKIYIDNHNQSLFINLIALEHCQEGLVGYAFTSFARTMQYLVRSIQDVDYLKKRDILVTNMSREDIARLFKSVCEKPTYVSYTYYNLANAVYLYDRAHWQQRLLIRIKRDYLYNPSSIWSISNAVILVVILTITQTIYTILSYYKS